jgi:hypothetical protein
MRGLCLSAPHFVHRSQAGGLPLAEGSQEGQKAQQDCDQ